MDSIDWRFLADERVQNIEVRRGKFGSMDTCWSRYFQIMALVARVFKNTEQSTTWRANIDTFWRVFSSRKTQNVRNPVADLKKHEEKWHVDNGVSRRKSRYLYPHHANASALRTKASQKAIPSTNSSFQKHVSTLVLKLILRTKTS